MQIWFTSTNEGHKDLEDLVRDQSLAFLEVFDLVCGTRCDATLDL